MTFMPALVTGQSVVAISQYVFARVGRDKITIL